MCETYTQADIGKILKGTFIYGFYSIYYVNRRYTCLFVYPFFVIITLKYEINVTVDIDRNRKWNFYLWLHKLKFCCKVLSNLACL